MDVPISIGVTLAAAMSLFETMTSGAHAFFDSAVTLLFFLLVGRYLDARARGQARAAVAHLLSLGAAAVTIVRPDGTTAVKPPSAVTAGRHGVDGDRGAYTRRRLRRLRAGPTSTPAWSPARPFHGRRRRARRCSPAWST